MFSKQSHLGRRWQSPRKLGHGKMGCISVSNTNLPQTLLDTVETWLKKKKKNGWLIKSFIEVCLFLIQLICPSHFSPLSISLCIKPAGSPDPWAAFNHISAFSLSDWRPSTPSHLIGQFSLSPTVVLLAFLQYFLFLEVYTFCTSISDANGFLVLGFNLLKKKNNFVSLSPARWLPIYFFNFLKWSTVLACLMPCLLIFNLFIFL